MLYAKSICIFVTSGGNTAAPGPNLIASNCEIGQLEFQPWVAPCWGMSTFCGLIVSRGIRFIVRLGIPYCSQLPHTLHHARPHHLECDLGNGRTFDPSEVVHLEMNNYFKLSR